VEWCQFVSKAEDSLILRNTFNNVILQCIAHHVSSSRHQSRSAFSINISCIIISVVNFTYFELCIVIYIHTYIRNKNQKMHTVFICDFIQLYCLRHVSNNQVFILRKTCTCSSCMVLFHASL
jgi:hypothetical protein